MQSRHACARRLRASRRSRPEAKQNSRPLPRKPAADGRGRNIYKMFHFVECVGGRVVLPVLSVRFVTRETLRGQEAATAADTRQKKKALFTAAALLSKKRVDFQTSL
jgi:hypothetical protein